MWFSPISNLSPLCMANVPTANFPVVSYEDHTYQWTGKRNKNGLYIVLLDGQEQEVWDTIDECSLEFYLPTGTITDCEGLCHDGYAVLTGKDPANKQVKVAIKYPTLQEVYTKQELFDSSIRRSVDYGECPPMVKCSSDVLMMLFESAHLEGTKEFDEVAKLAEETPSENASQCNESSINQPTEMPSEGLKNGSNEVSKPNDKIVVKVELELDTFKTAGEVELFAKLVEELPLVKVLSLLNLQERKGTVSIII